MKWDREIIRSWVAGVLAGIYSPEPDEEIWEWAERTLRIPATENEEMAGMLWSSSFSPYVRELMKWVRRPGKGEFWIKKSSQVGFTMAVLIIICWTIVHRPGNVGYAIDSKEEAKNISKVRLRNWITQNRLLESIGEDEDDMNNLTYYLRGMTVYMLGAFSKGSWANKSIALFILDELDKHPYIEGEGTTVALARERCKRPKNAKIIGFSTPGETNQIHKEWEKGTREEIRIPFPCCGHYQPLKWENFVFGTKEFKDLAGAYDREKVNKHAYFKCELCASGKLFEHQKLAAMQRFECVPTNDKATGRVRSLHIWDAYSAFVTFGEIALEWIDAQGDESLMERFFRGKRGEQFEKSTATMRHADILKCRGAYRRGELNFAPVFLGQTIDRQKDVCKTAKIAVDEKGNIHVIDWMITLSLEEAMDWSNEPVRGADGNDYYVMNGFCDEGFHAAETRRACYDRLPIWWPVKGRGGIQVRQTISTSDSWVFGNEEIKTYHIADDQFKWNLLHMITGHDKRKKRGEPVIFFPLDLEDDEDFMDELTNEQPVNRPRRNGAPHWEWELVNKTKPNDWLDVVKYFLPLWMVKRPFLVREGITR